MKARSDIDWFGFAVFVAAYMTLKGVGTRTLGRQLGIPRSVIVRARRYETFRGCKYLHFLKLCAWMRAKPSMFDRRNIAPMTRVAGADLTRLAAELRGRRASQGAEHARNVAS